MTLKTFGYILTFSSLVLACGQSSNRDGYNEDHKGSQDTSESISGLLPDTSDSGKSDSSDITHLDENNDQRGTRIHAGPDSANKKE